MFIATKMAENRGQLPEYEFDRSNFEELLAIELAKTPDGDVFRFLYISSSYLSHCPFCFVI